MASGPYTRSRRLQPPLYQLLLISTPTPGRSSRILTSMAGTLPTARRLGGRNLPLEVSKDAGIRLRALFIYQQLGVLVLLQEEGPSNRDTYGRPQECRGKNQDRRDQREGCRDQIVIDLERHRGKADSTSTSVGSP